MDGYAVELFCPDHTVTNILTQLEHSLYTMYSVYQVKSSSWPWVKIWPQYGQDKMKIFVHVLPKP